MLFSGFLDGFCSGGITGRGFDPGDFDLRSLIERPRIPWLGKNFCYRRRNWIAIRYGVLGKRESETPRRAVVSAIVVPSAVLAMELESKMNWILATVRKGFRKIGDEKTRLIGSVGACFCGPCCFGIPVRRESGQSLSSIFF